jgi:hypothetical protein
VIDFDDAEDCESCKLWYTLEMKAKQYAMGLIFIH